MVAKNLESIRPLSSLQIEKRMRRYRPSFKGVFDMDSLPRKKYNYPWAIIANTNKDTTTGVGHWVAFVFDSNGKGHYFDSYGKPPLHRSWRHYLHTKSKNGKWQYSTRQVQKFNTNTCGYLSMDFIVKRLNYPLLTNNNIVKQLSGMKSYKRFITRY